MNKSFYNKNRQRLAAHMLDHDVMLFLSGESARKERGRKLSIFCES